MSVNKFKPHVLVIPEDDANRQIANGFLLRLPSEALRRIQVLPDVGGWIHVREELIRRSPQLVQYTERRIIGLVDFDDHEDRRASILAEIDPSVKDRVFLLGSRGEPEELKKQKLGSFEMIGKALANDCMNGTSQTWGHPLLNHNSEELGRMQAEVVPILFNLKPPAASAR